MVGASNSFHAAVADGNPQRCLLDFSTTIFTNEDIDMENGIEYNDVLNDDENLTIGKAPCSTLSFTVFNDEKRLASFKFGKMVASIGVRVIEGEYTATGNCNIMVGGNVNLTGSSSSPYLKVNNSAANIQPSWAVQAIAVDGDIVYAIKSDGTIWTAKLSGTTLTRQTDPSVNAFMKNKLAGWASEHRGMYRRNDSTNGCIFYVTEYTDGVSTTWEYVKLGTFNAKRPASVRRKQIDVMCYDRMEDFDISFKNKVASTVTYPITAKNLLRKICTKLDVPLNESSLSTMVNDLSLSAKKASFDSYTCRDFVKFIAEQGGCYAKMNRQGQLEMKWFTTTSVAYDENYYEDYDPAWYDDAKVDTLHNRPGGSTDEVQGSGDNAYLISGNPFLP